MNNNKDYLYKLRHSAEHVLHQAIKQLYPSIHLAMGPATDEGFYCDFDGDTKKQVKISEEDFAKIEAEMQKIIDADMPFIQKQVSENEAREVFKDNAYKQEWIDEAVKAGNKITVYWTGKEGERGSMVDLCKGPHVKSTGEVKAFKLLSVAGAYWRGDEKNKMLTRIYGTAFDSKKDLDEYLKLLEERKANDHRILGQKLDLFCFSDIVGKGLVMYTPKGTIIKNELKKALVEISKKYGVQEVNIPHMAKIDLYQTSGHAEKFEEELFKVQSHYSEEFVLKPVNCPHHTQIYASRQRSYKDLPIRYIESTQQHRDEKPGSMGGLNRTRSFEIDDGHTFCTPDQIKAEVINTIKIVEEFYTSLGMWGNHWVSLSFRDQNTPEKYIGTKEGWEKAENLLREVNRELELNAKEMPGEAALYGPKIDFMLKDALGNDRQLATVQVDFAMPKRFGLTYINANGKEQTPVMLHRAILGSYGRFIANLLETTGGAFPAWLAPTQVQVLPVSEKSVEYAKEVAEDLKDKNIRVEVDESDETMGNKIRKAQEQKVPYMIIVGEKEQQESKVSIRFRDGTQQNMVHFKSFAEQINKVINSKTLKLQ
jgi:threonyl-tRNA synthetase